MMMPDTRGLATALSRDALCFPNQDEEINPLATAATSAGEVGSCLSTPSAEKKAGHADNFDRGANGLFSLLTAASTVRSGSHDESPRQKGNFLAELAHAAFDHLFR